MPGAYRDETEAAMHRAASLEQELADAKANNAALEARLASANEEVLRLRLHGPLSSSPPAPPPAANVWVLRTALGAALVMLVPLLVASYQSESGGIGVALLALPMWGAALGAWIARRRPVVACVGATVLGAALTFLLLALFFSTIWRAL